MRTERPGGVGIGREVVEESEERWVFRGRKRKTVEKWEIATRGR